MSKCLALAQRYPLAGRGYVTPEGGLLLVWAEISYRISNSTGLFLRDLEGRARSGPIAAGGTLFLLISTALVGNLLNAT